MNLLDPGQSHGTGPLLLKRLLPQVHSTEFNSILSHLKHAVAYRDLNDIKVNVLMENSVQFNDKQRRDIDIVIILEARGESRIIAIENKIRPSSYDTAQLIDEYNGLLKKYPGAIISILYLIPSQSPKFAESFKSLPDDIIKKQMLWSNKAKTEEMSMVDILRKILQDDNEARINPLSQEVRLVIKSFIVFAENGFVSEKDQIDIRGTEPTSKYFRGTVSGLEGIGQLIESNTKVILIGFDGGRKALIKADLSYLEGRYYKWEIIYQGRIGIIGLRSRSSRK